MTTTPFTTPLCDALNQKQLNILEASQVHFQKIARSQEGRPLFGAIIGNIKKPLVSIVAGAHPDEPAGPIAALQFAMNWKDNPLNEKVHLAIIPQIDCDGVVAQQAWLRDWDKQKIPAADPLLYAHHRIRRLPGEDREFAWPHATWGGKVLPENAGASKFLDNCGPALCHLSLHGLSISQGAWYLLDELSLRDKHLWQDLRCIALKNNFGIHPGMRHGDKGFRSAGSGFCTHPRGRHMRRWCLDTNKTQWAKDFAYSSMEAAAWRCHVENRTAPRCAVSEFPLFQHKKALFQNPETGEKQTWSEAIQSLAFLKLNSQEAQHNLKQLYAGGLETVPFSAQYMAMQDMINAFIRSSLHALNG